MLSELFQIDKIFGFCEKILYFFIINVLFALCVFPVLLFFLFLGIGQVAKYLPLFLLCMISVPPAFCGVVYAMRRLLDGRERSPIRDYVAGYKSDWLQKIGLSALQMLLVLMFYSNIQFFTRQLVILPLAMLFVFLLALTIIMTPNICLLASRYNMKNIQILKTACVLTITRPVCTLGSVAALGLVLILFELIAGTAVLCMVSIFGFLVVFMSRGMMDELEKTSTNSGTV